MAPTPTFDGAHSSITGRAVTACATYIEGMVFLGLGFFELLFLGIWIFALVDVLLTPAEEVRNLQKVLWFLIVLLGFEVVGAAFWFVYGRPRSSVPAGRVAPGSGTARARSGPRRSVAPDDDVDFLRSLNHPPDGPPAGI